MNTLYIHPQNPQARLIDEVIDTLTKGQAVLLPTAFGYGLAIGLNDKKTFKKLSTYLNTTPYLVCRDLSEISKFASLDDTAFAAVRTELKQRAYHPFLSSPQPKMPPNFWAKRAFTSPQAIAPFIWHCLTAYKRVSLSYHSMTTTAIVIMKWANNMGIWWTVWSVLVRLKRHKWRWCNWGIDVGGFLSCPVCIPNFIWYDNFLAYSHLEKAHSKQFEWA